MNAGFRALLMPVLLLCAGALRGGEASGAAPAESSASSAEEALPPSAPPAALKIGQWAEWRFVRKADDGKEDEAPFLFRLTVTGKQTDGQYLVRFDMKVDAEILSREEVPLDIEAIWKDLAAASEAVRKVSAADEDIAVQGRAVACRREVLAIGPFPEDGNASQTLTRWISGEVPLGPVRLRSEFLAVDLVAQGAHQPPPFPFVPNQSSP